MEIRILTTKDEYWNKTIEASEKCSWPAGINLGKKMRNNEFIDFEYPVVAIEDDRIVGFCCLLNKISSQIVVILRGLVLFLSMKNIGETE